MLNTGYIEFARLESSADAIHAAIVNTALAMATEVHCHKYIYAGAQWLRICYAYRRVITSHREFSRLSLALKMRLYNSLVISIITYSSASWTLTKSQKKLLDAFNTKSLRRIVGARWYDYVTNASLLTRTEQPPLTTTICNLRLSAFGHICRLHPGTHAIGILGSKPPSSWRRPGGRPPLRWADQTTNDTQMSLSDAVTATYDRTSWRSLVRDATRPATQAT